MASGNKSESEGLGCIKGVGDRFEVIIKERRLELAKKLITPRQGITRAEKNDIYRFLTGMEPAQFRRTGRRPNTDRDFDLAMDFLKEKAGKRVSGTKIMKKLGAKYQLPGGADVEPITFYKALSKGIEAIEGLSMKFLRQDRDGLLLNMNEEYKNRVRDKSVVLLHWIDQHRRKFPKGG